MQFHWFKYVVKLYNDGIDVRFNSDTLSRVVLKLDLSIHPCDPCCCTAAGLRSFPRAAAL
jgi:hypothetical protein